MNFRKAPFLAAAACSLFALPAAAQDLCGGLGAQGVWVGGDEASSDIATSASFLEQANVMVPPNGYAYSLFSLSAPSNVRVEAAGQADSDTVIDLYDASGMLILSDDDGGGGWNSRGEIELAAGSYCLGVRSFGGEPIVADARIGRANEHEALTAGLVGFDGGAFVGIDTCQPDTPATTLGSGMITASMSEGVSATNTISGVPYYRFNIGEPTAVTIRADNEMADPYIYIFDGQGQLIAENDDYNSLNSRIDFTTPLQPGSYCIGMRSLSDPNLPVTVSVAPYSQEEAMREMYATLEASPPIGGTYPIQDLGTLSGMMARDAQVSGDAVWYSFTVPEDGFIVIDAIGIRDSDPVIALYDGVGRDLAWNDDINGDLDSQIASRLSAGTYLLGVSQYSDSYNGIIRVSMERYVPAQ
jgi:hypothetical protein